MITILHIGTTMFNILIAVLTLENNVFAKLSKHWELTILMSYVVNTHAGEMKHMHLITPSFYHGDYQLILEYYTMGHL